MDVFEPVQIRATRTQTLTKFLLISKESFQLVAAVTTGNVFIGVGLDKQTVATDPIWTLEGVPGKCTLSIEMTDPNFHFGTWYYVRTLSRSL